MSVFIYMFIYKANPEKENGFWDGVDLDVNSSSTIHGLWHIFGSLLTSVSYTYTSLEGYYKN